ncbi:hypothetical protein GGF32_005096 [Allomyces javanicus]|nr:hypothetical protein GGF32_005096 [Allomyces javanicus]
MFASLPTNLQGAMLHYLGRHMAARFVVETMLAMHQYTLTEAPHLLFNLIAEIMQEEGHDVFDVAAVFEFAMHALRAVLSNPEVYGTDWMPDDDEDEEEEGSGSDEESEESEESGDESDGRPVAPDGWAIELRPDPTLHDLGGDLDWYQSMTSKEHFTSIRGLHSTRFVTRSPRWPVQFAVPSTTIHFQCANSLALGPFLPPFDGLVLQQPYTVRGDKIFTRSDPNWYSPRCQNRKGHTCLETLDDCPLSITAQHGYMMTGSERGDLVFFCNQPPAADSENGGDSVPSLEMIALMDADDMYNSTQIIDGPFGGYFGIAALNDGIVEIYPLPAHDVPNVTVRPHASPSSAVRRTWVVNFPGCINDAKFSPDRQWLACVSDHGAVWLTRVQWAEPLADGRVPSPKFGTPVRADLTHPVLLAVALHDAPTTHRRLDAAAAMRDLMARVTSQYVAWAPCATRFAVSCDTVPHVLVFAVDGESGPCARLEHVIGTAQPTYAIAFHPSDRSILAVSNRHGFVQVIDVEGHVPLKLPEVPKGCSLEDAAVKWDKETLTMIAASAKRYLRDVIQVTYGSKTSCVINGLQWTVDGRYLYIATNQRVLVYQFNRVSPLFDLVAEKLSLIGTENKAMPIMCYNRFQEATVGMRAKFRH